MAEALQVAVDHPCQHLGYLGGHVAASIGQHQVHHAPVVVGLGTHETVTPDLQDLVERQGLPWLSAVSPLRQPDARDLWAALSPVLAQIG